jgi:hypothetical protein
MAALDKMGGIAVRQSRSGRTSFNHLAGLAPLTECDVPHKQADPPALVIAVERRRDPRAGGVSAVDATLCR